MIQWTYQPKITTTMKAMRGVRERATRGYPLASNEMKTVPQAWYEGPTDNCGLLGSFVLDTLIGHLAVSVTNYMLL